MPVCTHDGNSRCEGDRYESVYLTLRTGEQQLAAVGIFDFHLEKRSGDCKGELFAKVMLTSETE